jgi:hypothetical protein
MTKIYSFASKQFRAITLLGLLAIATNASAQNSTVTMQSRNCGVIRENFDQGNGGYTSPSLYSDQKNDSAFYYKQSEGFWTELGEDGVTRGLPAVPRAVSILSTVYPSPAQKGSFDVGFVYVVPNPSVDQFYVALVRLETDAAGVTAAETIARSGYKLFTEYSSIAPTPYIDPVTPLQNGQRGAICIRLRDADITVGPNINYRVEVTYNIRSGGTYTIFDDFSFGNVEQSPLPVNFIGISAKRTDNTVEVRWDVADEINVDHYEIEKSLDGRNFQTIGNVYAGKKNVYSYTDGQITSGAALYRVKNVDIDGRSKYSNIVRINFNKIIELKAFPSPADNLVTIEHPTMVAKGKVTVATADGRTVKMLDAVQGTTQTNINLTGLNSGMYLVRFDNGSGKIETLKVIKQ